MKKHQCGFTLVELLIVIIILGILAAVAIPQLKTSAEETRESTLMADLVSMRKAIDLYSAQHKGSYPGTISGSATWNNFETHMTATTDEDGGSGSRYGPYMRIGIPRNPINGLNTGLIGDIPANPDDSTGWYYNATTGDLRANSSGTGPTTQIDYFDM